MGGMIMKIVRRSILSSLPLAVGLMLAAAPAFAQETLTVWWVKGFYKSEDDALFAAIKKFEDKSGVKIELSQYPVQDMIPKTVSALDSELLPMSPTPMSMTFRSPASGPSRASSRI